MPRTPCILIKCKIFIKVIPDITVGSFIRTSFDIKIFSLARDKLSSKQFSMVSSRPAIEESLTVDPSIRSFMKHLQIFYKEFFRFFGAEWRGVTDRWLVTVTTINTILESLDTRSLDIIQLNSVFSTLARLETEISLHTEAVLSGEHRR